MLASKKETNYAQFIEILKIKTVSSQYLYHIASVVLLLCLQTSTLRKECLVCNHVKPYILGR